MAEAAAGTAYGPLVIVAADQHESHPLVVDPLAGRILPGPARAVVAATRLGIVRRALKTATDKQMAGLWGSILCRKKFIDDKIREMTDLESVVILGAGFDTRAYRMPELAGSDVFEVDLPVNIDRKRAAVAGLPSSLMAASVTYVPIDFQAGDLAKTLTVQGYQAGGRTFFVWEAVSQYLTDNGVRSTFEFLRDAAAGSALAFTYIQQDYLDGAFPDDPAYQDFVVKRKLWHFGRRPDEVAGFLAEYGWREVEQLGREAFTERYIEPNGRTLAVSDVERSVYAVKQ